ncbi:dihydrolipoyl dehydrogenase [Sphingomonas sp. A2-49]|uniref:dihydrolipoyl dehydrogenase n=1 Tax=Sphingomonas sp. A2-49 TaxID=1391375 RepID=UPI0021D19647|nr:dihydrolipoyl dehydrogenase [Sphingomonas sp. A2-49]MCU6453165.1 dihydrolipoyl dehydrogenase [Sphingomonas sp. A2-49]
MADLTCDVAVIGAGTAGLAAERSARATGARTLLIDDRFAGTTCATVGCMPSKLLIAAGKSAAAVRLAPVFGIDAPAPRVDGVAVMARVRAERDKFVAATRKSFDKLPEGTTIQATARIQDAATLRLDDGRTVSARAVVIATGSKPTIPQAYQSLGDLVLTSDTIFDLVDLPRSVAVIGTGPLGVELAHGLAQLGVEVEVFGQNGSLAGVKDEAVMADLCRILRKVIAVRLDVTVEAQRHAGGALLRWSGAESGEKVFERVLVATGRRPSLDRLDLAAAGLALDDKGVPLFDRHTMQCGDATVFIAGDADADAPILHEASTEGAIAGTNAASFPEVKPTERALPFSITFTDPPVAAVGDPAGDDSVIGCASYEDQGRAKVEARAEGCVRIYAAPGDGRLTGAAMIGPGMEHIAHLLTLAITQRMTATELLRLPFYHPTLEEGLKPALRQICHSVHAPIPVDSGDPAGA